MSVHVELLRRAAEILGGKAALRAWLRVSSLQLESWMEGAARPPAYVFLKVVDLVTGVADCGRPEVVRRSIELRRKATLVNEAARLARENTDKALAKAASTLERAQEIQALQLSQKSPPPARRRKLSAEDFAAAKFAASDGGLLVECALRAAVSSTAAARANVQLVSPEGLRMVGQLGFEEPFVKFFATVNDRTPASCDRALKLARRTIVTDVRTHPIFAGTEAGDVMQRAGGLACQSTPLLGTSGR